MLLSLRIGFGEGEPGSKAAPGSSAAPGARPGSGCRRSRLAKAAPGQVLCRFEAVTPGGDPAQGGARVTRWQTGTGDRYPGEERLQGENPSLKPTPAGNGSFSSKPSSPEPAAAFWGQGADPQPWEITGTTVEFPQGNSLGFPPFFPSTKSLRRDFSRFSAQLTLAF